MTEKTLREWLIRTRCDPPWHEPGLVRDRGRRRQARARQSSGRPPGREGSIWVVTVAEDATVSHESFAIGEA
jgi:hypothetical protein